MSARDQATDFLEKLDAAIGCQQCTLPLDEHAVSDYFCSEECSLRWADVRTPRTLDFDYYENVDEDGHNWAPDDLTDLEPVSWISPPVWRLPRSTGDLDADRRTLDRALELAQTDAQRAACAVRLESLNERRRAVWAREWRLPRSTGTFWHDQLALHHAERTATTDAQRAACALRRESLRERHPRRHRPSLSESIAAVPGHQTSWGLDGYLFGGLRDFPIIPREEAQRAADAILASRPADSEFNAVSVLGDAFSNNLPGIARGSFTLRGRYEPALPPRMLTYELRRDSDETLLIVQAVPEDMHFTWSLPDWVDCTGCSVRVLHEGREIGRYPYVDARTPRPAPRPALDRGHTVSITTSDGTRSYTVEGVAPDGSLTCRRITEGEQPPTGGA